MIEAWIEKIPSEKLRKLFLLGWQFFKFTIVGVVNVCINLVVYFLLLFLQMSPYIANTIGYCAGLLNAYIWNVKWVFNKKAKLDIKAVCKFFMVYAFSYLISMLIMYVGMDMLGISEKIIPFVNLAVTTPINFLINKFWTFNGAD